MIARERGTPDSDSTEEVARPNLDYDPQVQGHPDSDIRPFEVVTPSWSIVGVARMQEEEERLFDIHRGEITWLEIDPDQECVRVGFPRRERYLSKLIR